jgi:Protein of unknown function (DUF2795)
MTQEFRNEPAAQKDDYERAFEGMAFPASLPYIIRTAHDRGGIDREVLDILHRLPEQDYDTLDDLIGAVRAVYASQHMKSPV